METEIQKTPTEEIIENAKKSEQEGSVSFMDPKPKLEKKKGRPPGSKKDQSQKLDQKSEKIDPKSEKSAPAFEIPTKALCVLPGKMVSSWGVAYTKNPKAAMTPDELEAFATGLGMVIDKHMPDAMKNYGPELMFAAALTQYGVRLLAIKKLMADHEKRMNQNNAVFNSEKKEETPQENKSRDDIKLVDTHQEMSIP